jgi:starch-binding outer membrane protein, SusD/RagB family
MRTLFRGRDASTAGPWTRRSSRYALAVLPLAVVMFACDSLTNLEQENPSQILANDAYVPRNATLLVNGAIGDFECALFRYTTAAGLLGDELVNAFANAAQDNYDRRSHPLTGPYADGCGGAQLPGVYTSLSVARASADTILARLQEWTDAEMAPNVNRTQLIGQAAAHAGYSLVLLGEGMCSAAINVGPELTPQQLFTEAQTRFNTAITASTTANDTITRNLARLGLARTLLNLAYVATPTNPNDPDLALVAQAGALAAQIGPGFAVNAAALATGTARQQNVVFAHSGGTGSSNFSSVDPTFDSLRFAGVLDPRVPVTNTGVVGADNATIVRQQRKYANLGSAIPFARSTEARLIEAEAKALANDRAGAMAIVNALHTAAGIPTYPATDTTQAEVLSRVREERRRELFLESHRLGDMRRLNLPLIPAVGATFPRGGIYGDQRCFPLPAVERNNNPNIPDA